MNTIATERPWPSRTISDYWGPHYRLALRNSSGNTKLLVVTETGFVLAADETAAVNISFTTPDPSSHLLEVGVARSDLPKELISSWKLQWASFRTDAPWTSGIIQDDSQEYWRAWLNACLRETNIATSQVEAIIFGSFVHPTKDSHHWVEITRGTIQQIRCDHKGWVDLLISIPLPQIEVRPKKGAAPVPAEPKDLKLTLVMLATLAVWLIKFWNFMRSHDPQLSTPPSDYAFFNLLHGITLADWGGHLVIAGFIVIHHLRMAVGVEFAGRDSSFFRAKLHAPFHIRTSREWIESLFLAIVVSCSVLLTYFVGHADYLVSTVLLFIQGIFVLTYDLAFWDALLTYDEGHRANRLVVTGDFLFLVATILILFNRIWNGPQTAPAFSANFGTIVMILCCVYFGLFSFEVFVAYKSAIGSAFREIGVALRHLTNRAVWFRHSPSSNAQTGKKAEGMEQPI
jgi:hypothetical protein